MDFNACMNAHLYADGTSNTVSVYFYIENKNAVSSSLL